jgi:hypothetical protein
MMPMMPMGVRLPLRLHLHVVPMIVPVHLLCRLSLSRSMSWMIVVGVLLRWHVPMVDGRVFHEEIIVPIHVLVFGDGVFVV